jgi:hypothetical protein
MTFTEGWGVTGAAGAEAAVGSDVDRAAC